MVEQIGRSRYWNGGGASKSMKGFISHVRVEYSHASPAPDRLKLMYRKPLNFAEVDYAIKKASKVLGLNASYLSASSVEQAWRFFKPDSEEFGFYNREEADICRDFLLRWIDYREGGRGEPPQAARIPRNPLPSSGETCVVLPLPPHEV